MLFCQEEWLSEDFWDQMVFCRSTSRIWISEKCAVKVSKLLICWLTASLCVSIARTSLNGVNLNLKVEILWNYTGQVHFWRTEFVMKSNLWNWKTTLNSFVLAKIYINSLLTIFPPPSLCRCILSATPVLTFWVGVFSHLINNRDWINLILCHFQTHLSPV